MESAPRMGLKLGEKMTVESDDIGDFYGVFNTKVRKSLTMKIPENSGFSACLL